MFRRKTKITRKNKMKGPQAAAESPTSVAVSINPVTNDRILIMIHENDIDHTTKAAHVNKKGGDENSYYSDASDKSWSGGSDRSDSLYDGYDDYSDRESSSTSRESLNSLDIQLLSISSRLQKNFAHVAERITLVAENLNFIEKIFEKLQCNAPRSVVEDDDDDDEQPKDRRLEWKRGCGSTADVNDETYNTTNNESERHNNNNNSMHDNGRELRLTSHDESQQHIKLTPAILASSDDSDDYNDNSNNSPFKSKIVSAAATRFARAAATKTRNESRIASNTNIDYDDEINDTVKRRSDIMKRYIENKPTTAKKEFVSWVY